MSDEVLKDGKVARWTNYHKTFAQEVRRVSLKETSSKPSCFDLLRTVAEEFGQRMGSGEDLRPEGGRWSFSPLCQTSGKLFEQNGAGFDWPLSGHDVASGMDATILRLVSGARTIRDLNASLADANPQLSLATSGASNGQAFAGATATGTHGSVMGWGGIQDHVIGMHIVGGPRHSHWVEATPTLSDRAMETLGAIRLTDARLFDAALVHLGGLGFVNALLIRR